MPLKKGRGKVVVTGHSLGGAMSTFCALDLAVHSLPRVNAYYKKMHAGLANHETACSIALYNFGSPKVGNSWFKVCMRYEVMSLLVCCVCCVWCMLCERCAYVVPLRVPL